jgi:glucosamine kinase
VNDSCDRTTLVAIFLGIDGGGTKTSCLVGDETSVLGSGTAIGSNIVRVGERQAREAIGAAIQQACADAKIAPAQVGRTCMGVAGAARLEVANVVRGLLAEFVSGEIEVVGDMAIAMEAAFGSGPGVIVIAGTGSIAYGRNAEGQTARAGGWGYAISDEGSGHWIGQSALAAAMRARDESGIEAPSPLLERIMKSWKVTTSQQLVVAANATPAPDFAALLPAVLSAADAGDDAARGVLTQAGVELAVLGEIVTKRLFEKADAVPLAMAGGVLRHCSLVREILGNTLRAKHPNVRLTESIVDPVEGALALARKGTLP